MERHVENGWQGQDPVQTGQYHPVSVREKSESPKIAD
jgi:hypothetical protein